MIVWHNGEWKEEDEACLRIDGGFLRGEGVFETMLGLQGRVFAKQAHWERLARGLECFGLEGIDEQSFKCLSEEVLERNRFLPDERVRVRVTVSEGHVLISAVPEVIHWEPLTLATAPYVRNERSALVGLKAISYAENSLALRWGRSQGAHEVLFANTRGHWCEGSWSNIFAVKEGRVFTPPLGSGCLPGVTRSLVIDLARDQGVETCEEEKEPAWLQAVDEIFLTSSLRGVVPVGRFDETLFPTGPLTQMLAVELQRLERQGVD
ncbi:MAG: aminotransferase class IV [Verrucomicrobiota bacterium JB023]|nr:aminotransferase class IV [Verrucomicrobiota bacterium JB023]